MPPPPRHQPPPTSTSRTTCRSSPLFSLLLLPSPTLFLSYVPSLPPSVLTGHAIAKHELLSRQIRRATPDPSSIPCSSASPCSLSPEPPPSPTSSLGRLSCFGLKVPTPSPAPIGRARPSLRLGWAPQGRIRPSAPFPLSRRSTPPRQSPLLPRHCPSKTSAPPRVDRPLAPAPLTRRPAAWAASSTTPPGPAPDSASRPDDPFDYVGSSTSWIRSSS